MEVVCKDWDIRYNYYAFKACIESEEELTVNKALSKMGLIDDTPFGKRQASEQRTNIEYLEKTLGEKLLIPKIKCKNVKVTEDMINQMNRLYYEVGLLKQEIASIYGVNVTRMYKLIKGKNAVIDQWEKYGTTKEYILEQLKYKTQNQLAREIGCAQSNISYFLTKNNIKIEKEN